MKIKNWTKFQHFKDRRPPWIKLYRDILDDVKWFELDAKLAKILVMLWLIASEEKDGELPDCKTLAFRLRLTEKEMNSAINGLSSWLIQSDCAMISARYQDDRPETETETETETKIETEAKRETDKRATRLPIDWKPTDAMIEYCITKRPELNCADVAESFKDYWIASPKGTKLDWDATWRTWVRNQRAQPGQFKPFESAKDKSRREFAQAIMGKVQNEQSIIDIN